MSQLDALSQLNELLSISNEESLSMFPLDQLIPILVSAKPSALRLLLWAESSCAQMCVLSV